MIVHPTVLYALRFYKPEIYICFECGMTRSPPIYGAVMKMDCCNGQVVQLKEAAVMLERGEIGSLALTGLMSFYYRDQPRPKKKRTTFGRLLFSDEDPCE